MAFDVSADLGCSAITLRLVLGGLVNDIWIRLEKDEDRPKLRVFASKLKAKSGSKITDVSSSTQYSLTEHTLWISLIACNLVQDPSLQ